MKSFSLLVLCLLLAGCAHRPCSPQAPAATAETADGGRFQCVYCDAVHENASWSDRSRAVSARDDTGFCGPFEARPVAFSLTKLPAHSWVRVRFSLLLFGKWDGSSRVWGPDLFSLSIRGGQRLLFATFGNCGFWVNNNEQSYPDEYPWAVHPGWTAASEKQVTGLRSAGFPMAPSPDRTDSVYPVEMIFPHGDGALTLDFAAIYDDQPGDQAWGIRDLEVSVGADAPTPADVLPALWSDLASPDPVKANMALWKFVGAGGAAKTFIAARVAELNRRVDSRDKQDGEAAANGLRLHRAHRIVRIIGGPDSGGTCFSLDHLFPEY